MEACVRHVRMTAFILQRWMAQAIRPHRGHGPASERVRALFFRLVGTMLFLSGVLRIVSEEVPMDIDIPRANLERLRKRTGRLAARAAGYGMPTPALVVVEEFERDLLVPDQFARLKGDASANRRVAVPMARISLEGASPWIEEWEVVGWRRAIRFAKDGFRIANYGSVAGDRGCTPLHCEHCGARRKRLTTYLLRRKDTDASVEVGSDCLGDFVGSAAGPRVIEGLDVLSSIFREFVEASDPYWRHGARGEILEEARLVMAVANRVIQDHGWIASGHAKSTGAEPTWRRVASALELSRSEEGMRMDSPIPLGGDFLAADDAIEWIHAAAGDEFLSAVAGVIDRGLAGPRDVAVLSAGVAAFRRHLERKAAADLEMALSLASTHVGEVGDRIERTVSVRRVIPVETKFGRAALVSMNDADGNLFSWLTNAPGAMKAGHCYEIRGTVRAHAATKGGAIKGTPETRLTRVAVLSEMGLGHLGPTAKADLADEDAVMLDEMLGSSDMSGPPRL